MHPYKTSRTEERALDRYYVDLRIFGLGNWSHFLNKALPASIIIRDHLAKLGQPEPIFVLGENVFPAIVELMEYMGLSFIRTSNAVSAAQVKIEFSDLSVLDRLTQNVIPSISSEITRMENEIPRNFGEAVFLNRKPPNRSISNSGEINKILSVAGYVEVYMEDYSAAEQIAIILRASKIVAIHGAALAPLMFRNERHGPLQFLEIAPPGHVVPFFRDMIMDIPCTYRMLRGVPDSAMVSDAFSNLENPSMEFTEKHSLRQFHVDATSMQFALGSMDDKNFPFDTISRPI